MTRRKWAGRHRKVPIGQINGISKHTIAKLASHTHTLVASPPVLCTRFAKSSAISWSRCAAEQSISRVNANHCCPYTSRPVLMIYRPGDARKKGISECLPQLVFQCPMDGCVPRCLISHFPINSKVGCVDPSPQTGHHGDDWGQYCRRHCLPFQFPV